MCLDDIRARLQLAMVQDQLLKVQRQQVVVSKARHSRIAAAAEKYYSRQQRRDAADRISVGAHSVDLGLSAESCPSFFDSIDCSVGSCFHSIILYFRQFCRLILSASTEVLGGSDILLVVVVPGRMGVRTGGELEWLFGLTFFVPF